MAVRVRTSTIVGRRRVAAGAAALAVLITACGSGSDGSAPDSTPDGATVLSENQPSSIEGVQVVATDVDGDTATLSVSEDGPAQQSAVTEGGDVTIGGGAYRVEAIWSEGDGDQPGSMGGRVMVVPEDG